MAEWLNRDLIAFHGTDSHSVGATAGQTGTTLRFTADLANCRSFADFGRGFYMTTSLHQAQQWASRRAAYSNARSRSRPSPTVATVLQFTLSRDWLAGLEGLSFVLESSDFWALVSDCRSYLMPHQRTGKRKAYDVVYGPVSLWPQRLVIKDCDQISFHTRRAVSALPAPLVLKMANETDETRTSF